VERDAVSVRGNGHARSGSAVEGGTKGRRAIVMVDVPDSGLYTIWAFGLVWAGQNWTADPCMKSVLCASRDPRNDVASWRLVLTSQFNSGRHTAATLRRLGSDVGTSGPMPRDRAVGHPRPQDGAAQGDEVRRDRGAGDAARVTWEISGWDGAPGASIAPASERHDTGPAGVTTARP
jgi:hypothetical protein